MPWRDRVRHNPGPVWKKSLIRCPWTSVMTFSDALAGDLWTGNIITWYVSLSGKQFVDLDSFLGSHSFRDFSLCIVDTASRGNRTCTMPFSVGHIRTCTFCRCFPQSSHFSYPCRPSRLFVPADWGTLRRQAAVGISRRRCPHGATSPNATAKRASSR